MKSRLLLAFFCLCFLIGASGAETPYKIGVILPLSGDVAHFGNSIRRGIDLAVEELPAEQRAKFQVVYEDAFSSASATSAFQ